MSKLALMITAVYALIPSSLRSEERLKKKVEAFEQ